MRVNKSKTRAKKQMEVKMSEKFNQEKWKEWLEGVFVTPEENKRIKGDIWDLYNTKKLEEITSEDIFDIIRKNINWYGGDNEHTKTR